jgi:hypothetical protein
VTKKTPKKVDRAFEKAIEELERYEKECHPEKRVVNEKMAAAKARDITISTSWSFLRLKKVFSPKVRLGPIRLLHFICG